jgi:acetolactate synthase-1/2/3 large subunit
MIRYELEKMLFYAKEGRQGPVLMDLPDDLQRSQINPKNLRSFKPPKKKIIKNKFKKKFLEILKKSKRPLILVGHGINLSNTKKKLFNFIQKTGIPFAPSWATVDLFSSKDT